MPSDKIKVGKSETSKVDPFGIGYIRPTRSQAEESSDRFYNLIAYLRAKRGLTWQKIGEQIGIDATNALRRINGQSISKDERELILDYIYDISAIISDPSGSEIRTIRDNLYFSLVDFYKMKSTTQDNIRSRCIGTYQLWRHSVESPGEYVHGRVDFFEDETTGALCVKMIQPRKEREGMRASTEEFSGYLFRVADKYVMLLRDIANSDLRITIFPHFRVENIGTDKTPNSMFPGSISHIVHMSGLGMGMDSHNVFASPVYLELVDDNDKLANLTELLDVISESDTPKRIISKLKRIPLTVI